MVVLKTIFAALALLSSTVSASSSIEAKPDHSLKQSAFNIYDEAYVANGTLSAEGGFLTFEDGYVRVKPRLTPWDNPIIWTVKRDCRNRNWQIFHNTQFNDLKYITSGNPVTINTYESARFEVRLRVVDKHDGGPEALYMYFKSSNAYCMGIDKEGRTGFTPYNPCYPFLFKQIDDIEYINPIDSCNR